MVHECISLKKKTYLVVNMYFKYMLYVDLLLGILYA